MQEFFFQSARKIPTLFENRIGKFKNYQVSIHIDESIKPSIQRYRPIIPHAQRKKVEEELKRMLDQDIVEKADGPTTWVSPLVVVPRKDTNEIRICIDARMINKAICVKNDVLFQHLTKLSII